MGHEATIDSCISSTCIWKSKDHTELRCVFHDKEGERVHATVDRNLIGKFESTMNELELFNGRVDISTTFNASKLGINSCSEVDDFKDRYKVQVRVQDEH
ncbi:hypothetical protein ACS0TY_030979 [Phlomoides rotata]